MVELVPGGCFCSDLGQAHWEFPLQKTGVEPREEKSVSRRVRSFGSCETETGGKVHIGIIINRLCGQEVRHSLRDGVVRGSIPGRVKPRTLKLVLAADPPSIWYHGFSAKSSRPGVRIM
ncbi:hypothetical protein ElyMa_003175600 [Elysia marginata]|uniref:Uncharacterized protein n=1 Tax=Elysia marginata TaxID=1093978 RepID=A0AAV4J0I9_9GAST|nr:hypothetical protein ElyMa_003175600 [Elysia marginata]